MMAAKVERCQGAACSLGAEQVWYCVDCDFYFCDDCWALFPVHAGGRTGRDKLLHEKTEYHIFQKLDAVLHPSYPATFSEELHRRDAESTWFGIRRDVQSHLFVDYDAYTTLMGDLNHDFDSTFPQLVSFVGETKAGKSTLINMLMQLNNQNSSLPTPVVGFPASQLPTSADVHLYADPSTFQSNTPILYVDCEGFQGGSKLPLGAVENIFSRYEDRTNYRLTPGRKRRLDWARRSETNNRGYVVSQLYPRILYTFSDVVVFVLQNANVFESTALRLLLEWGSASLETSINQPTLPHAIIALNRTDTRIKDSAWDVKIATQSLLETAKDCLDAQFGDSYFCRLANQWRRKGKPIRNVLDLLHCYYSTFRVVPIPIKGRYQLLNTQITKLHRLIVNARESSFKAKQLARMLSNSDELNFYFQSAFDHFTHRLDVPFNFIEISLKVNPIPENFGDHLLQLAILVTTRHPRQDPTWIFERLSKMVASSVMLDWVRHRKGVPEDLFGQYQRYFCDTLNLYGKHHVPCDFRSSSERCVVSAGTHKKEHQNVKGHVIAAGNFYSSFNAPSYIQIWQENIKIAITRLYERLQSRIENDQHGNTEERHFLPLHNKVIQDLYRHIGNADNFQSHSTCFCCLMHVPYHALPCGHVLCTRCIRAYGQPVNGQHNRFVLSLDFCPLHEETRHKWHTPLIIRFKPDHAGIRILSLDGSGGIVALAFAVKGWDLRECIEFLMKFYQTAFTRRTQTFSNLKYFIRMKSPSKYKTKPMRRMLEKTFGKSENLFGHKVRDNANQAKVAVTATDITMKRTVVIANYGRKDSRSDGRRRRRYDFPRPHDTNEELKVWEAAAATTASLDFKPFYHQPSKLTYLDGALLQSNPIKIAHRERKLLWPDVASRQPDLVLSIGTSQNGTDIGRHVSQNTLRSTGEQKKTKSGSNKISTFELKPPKRASKAMNENLNNILDAEVAWRDFCDDFAEDDYDRYVRINPNIGHDPPKYDEVDQMERLQEETRSALKTPQSKSQIQYVAHKLVASSFYYERTTVRGGGDTSFIFCSGRIRCRFENGSLYIRALGEYLGGQQIAGFLPYFEIEGGRNSENPKVEITKTITDDMRHCSFELDLPEIPMKEKTTKITISMHLWSPPSRRDKIPISGFPRAIFEEGPVKVSNDGHRRAQSAPTALELPNQSIQELPLRPTNARASDVGSREHRLPRPHVVSRSVSENLDSDRRKVQESRGRHFKANELAANENLLTHSQTIPNLEPAVELESGQDLPRRRGTARRTFPHELDHQSFQHQNQTELPANSPISPIAEMDSSPKRRFYNENNFYHQQQAPLRSSSRWKKQILEENDAGEKEAFSPQSWKIRGQRDYNPMNVQSNQTQTQHPLSFDPNDPIRKQVDEYLKRVDLETLRKVGHSTQRSPHFMEDSTGFRRES